MTTIDERISDQWESGELGREPAHVQRASADVEAEIDRATAMKLVTMRLPVPMIDALKTVARFHGVGYQPMVRDLLSRFIASEVPTMLDRIQRKAAETASETTTPVDHFMGRRATRS